MVKQIKLSVLRKMGKHKKRTLKRTGLSDKVLEMKRTSSRNTNPFEVHYNRDKNNVLGKKKKNEMGLPYISRHKALKKRKQTLLREYKQLGKSNSLIDKRIGEYDLNQTEEDKIVERLALERKRAHEKNAIFNLNDAEELTHHGQSLSANDHFDDVEKKDEDSGDEWFSKDFTAAAHFGGGYLEKQRGDKKNMSKKEMIEEVIEMSKRKKHEQQEEKEHALDMTEKLDAQWNDIANLLAHSKRKTLEGVGTTQPKKGADDFDKLVRELQLDLKARPTDRLKTQEELATNEKKRLDELERDRVYRMSSDSTRQSSTITHISADQLCSGSLYNQDNKFTLQYKDGKCSLPQSEELKHKKTDGEIKDKVNISKGKQNFKNSNYEDEDGGEIVLESKEDCPPGISGVPASSAEFFDLIKDCSLEDTLDIIKHIFSSAKLNAEKSQSYFRILAEYISEIAQNELQQKLVLVDKLTPYLYQLMQQSPSEVAEYMQGKVVIFLQDFTGEPKQYPSLDVIIYLKLIGVLYPTSDFQHPVVTPAAIFMSQLLSQCPVVSPRGVISGLILCTLFLEYVSVSKRFVPEVVNFLHGLLFLAAIKPHKVLTALKVFPPFKSAAKTNNLLLVLQEEACETLNNVEPINFQEFVLLQEKKEADIEFKYKTMYVTLQLLNKCVEFYSPLPSCPEVFTSLQAVVAQIPWERYPPTHQTLQVKLLEKLESSHHVKLFLACNRKTIHQIKLYEPLIEDNFDGRRKRKGSKELAEQQRLMHKLKQETKGALKELRKDSQFLATERLKEQKQKDVERKTKVKRLYSLLGNQEGDYKALIRKKQNAK